MNDASDIKQILQRVTRIETRLVKLGEAQGIDVMQEGHAPKMMYDPVSYSVLVTGLDVTLSDVLRCAEAGGVRYDWVEIVHSGKRMGEVYVEGGKA